ncbi:hypothetical protein [Nocardiopsis sp. JB363]|uniref:hypothetical protein n=1 Tax=Nocardiopsis sp. JB363 TaxID=1434837 RepID=UPI00097A694E|nr:hypothetical protein [Nocardiopsis sp. JB363]SIO86456.1 hypothetical protein BQ8420_12095 [Nocardiopsis sp. JB363]
MSAPDPFEQRRQQRALKAAERLAKKDGHRCHDCGHKFARLKMSRCPACLDKRSDQEAALRERHSHQALPTLVQDRLLKQLAAGEDPVQVCAELNITTQRIYHHRLYDPAWEQALDEALTAGRAAGLEHGHSSTYKWDRCRCPECKAAHHPKEPVFDLEGMAARDRRRRAEKRRLRRWEVVQRAKEDRETHPVKGPVGPGALNDP